MTGDRWRWPKKEYRIRWCQRPHVHFTMQVLFIEAASADDAKAIARDHIERKFGIESFSIFEAVESKPRPAGRVVGEGR